jgi:hypothetical protein
VKNTAIRRKILEMLYDSIRKHPYNRVTPNEFKESLGIDLRDLHFNIIYLEEKGLLELQKPLEGSLFVGARITPKGIDLVEDEYQMNVFFPQELAKPHIPDSIFHRLDSLIEETEGLETPSPDSRELIIEELKEIQSELKSKDPSYSRIKGFVDRLKERNMEVWQKLMGIIKDPAVARVLSAAAEKELGI